MEPTAHDPEDADRAAIRRTAMDYLCGWYEGDAERMRRALHPELAKRAILTDPQTGARRFHHLTQADMVAQTTRGGDSDVPPDQRYYDVAILDRYGDIASVRAESYLYVDYLHMARAEADGHWVIVNALWADNRAAPRP
ncbi:MAG TPA: nuclear transport factor 2 family protein [Ktedonobacterales bacterium]|jgi:hypothetical protein